MAAGEDAAAKQAQRFREARNDRHLVVLEGFHALKHALRFGAEVVEAVSTDLAGVERLTAELAPDLAAAFALIVRPLVGGTLGELVPQPPRTGVVAIARRPEVEVRQVLEGPGAAPIVLLEDPRSMGNLGACVRVAAAAEAGAVLASGHADPWNPEAVRGSAGLHFALPVAAIDRLPEGERALVAIDPGGEQFSPQQLPPRAVLAFGSERHGLSEELLERADLRLGLAMRAGVSSLNLATCVAAVLFSQRLLRG